MKISSDLARKRRWTQLLGAGMLCIAFTAPAHSGEIKNIYTAIRSDINPDKPDPRELQLALEQVIIKSTGYRDAVHQPAARSVLDNAEFLLKEFNAKQIEFAPDQTERLMQNLGLTLLGDDRPDLLVWLVGKKGDETAGASYDYLTPDGRLGELLKDDANVRGVPLLFPLLDLTDELTVTPSQIANLDLDVITAASERYGKEHILIGTIDTQTGAAEWLFYDNGSTFSFNSDSPESITQVFNQVSDQLLHPMTTPRADPSRPDLTPVPSNTTPSSAQTAPEGAALNQAIQPDLNSEDATKAQALPGQVVEFNDVANASDYLNLMDYLRSIKSISAMSTVQNSSHVLKLNIEAAAGTDWSQLMTEIAASDRLEQVAPDVFQWRAVATNSDSAEAADTISDQSAQ